MEARNGLPKAKYHGTPAQRAMYRAEGARIHARGLIAQYRGSLIDKAGLYGFGVDRAKQPHVQEHVDRVVEAARRSSKAQAMARALLKLESHPGYVAPKH